MLKYFNIEYEEEEFLKHEDHYKSLRRLLVDKPKRSDISRRQMIEVEKRKRNGVSPVVREEIRKGGRPKKEVIVVEDLPPTIINSSIDMLAMERKEVETEEERGECFSVIIGKSEGGDVETKNRYS
jgi:hypothetical protein